MHTMAYIITTSISTGFQAISQPSLRGETGSPASW